MSKSKYLKIPNVGRVGVVHEKSGEGTGLIGATGFDTNLTIQVFDKDGRPRSAKEVMSHWARFWGNIKGNDTLIDLGSGLTTNVGSLALANDGLWSVTNAPNNFFRFLKYHASGTGTTVAAATDIKLQTASTQGGQTPVVGTQVLVSAANAQKYQTVATIAYTGSEAVTEWGLFAYDSALPTTSNLSNATGSPFTAGSATTGTVTATPLTASSTSVMGQQMSIFENTGNATPSWGLVTSNTNAAVTVPAWYKVSDGTTGANPANTDTLLIRPIMFDHKVFSAVNVVNGDSIQITYTLTINSGG